MTPDPIRRVTIAGIIHCVGGVTSPLLCNIYLHRLDRAWDAREHGVLVRYCDDLVVMCHSRQQAEAALARLRSVLGGLGLELKQSKTRIVHLTEDKDAEGFDSWASITAGCVPGGQSSPAGSVSLPAGPRARRPSMPATGSGRSPAGSGC
jgi:hypothetical protein